MKEILIIGGGAAGLFAAINAPKNARVTLVEKSAKLLSKVKISGGGRCNVTHACFDPKALIAHYPRGGKELLGPLHSFGPKQMIHWLDKRGVKLKTEKDGRMFPITDSSQTIIDCFLNEAERKNVDIQFRTSIDDLSKVKADKIILATGNAPTGHKLAEAVGHTIIPPVPSLFTFNTPSSPLLDLSGITVSDVELKLANTRLKQRGPLLLTHWGFSGPAALKLSAWGARHLHDLSYNTDLVVNWLPDLSLLQIQATLLANAKSKQKLTNLSLFALPRNLWKRLAPDAPCNALSPKAFNQFAEKLHADRYKIEGKTTNKEEFVTCGGIARNEVNFKTMESKLHPGLYFAGEILDIDGVTGGFNFQNAWTTAYIALSPAAS